MGKVLRGRRRREGGGALPACGKARRSAMEKLRCETLSIFSESGKKKRRKYAGKEFR